MRPFLSSACLAAILCLISCGGAKNSLVGTWRPQLTGASATADVGIEFKADGTYKEWFHGSKVNNDSSGTYSLSGTELTITELSSTNSKGISTTDKKTWAERITWLGPDRMHIDGPEGGSLDYTRVK